MRVPSCLAAVFAVLVFVTSATPASAGPPVPARAAAPAGASAAAAPSSAEAVDGPESRAQNFTDIPANEISLGTPLGLVGAHDLTPRVHALTNNQVTLLSLEQSSLWSAWSATGGSTFGSEVLVAGDAGRPVFLFVSELAADGRLYVAYMSGDPGGDWGLRLVRSDDMGRSWTAPVDLVKRGDAQHGIRLGAVAANASGRVAVAFVENWEGGDAYVMTSSNSGATWTAPVRLDQGDAAGAFPCDRPEVEVSATGVVHAAFVQDRGTGNAVWYTRSLDGGSTFETERNFDAALANQREDSGAPDLELASDGSVLIAFHDLYLSDVVYVLRSTNAGVSFGLVYTGQLLGNGIRAVPRLLAAPTGGTVLLGYIAGNDNFLWSRSVNHGAAWSGANVVAGRAVSFELTRTGAGRWAAAYESYADDQVYLFFTDVYVRVSADDGGTWEVAQRADRSTPGTTVSPLGGIAAPGTDNLFVVFTDDRGPGVDVYANRSPAVPLDLTVNEARVDTDHGLDAVTIFDNFSLATDGADHAYAAFSADATGPWPDLYVAASADRGKTFAAPVRIGTHAPGSAYIQTVAVSAQPNGTVHLAFVRVDAAGTGQLVSVRSTNFGASWGAETVRTNTLATFGLRLSSTAAGRVVLAWSDGFTVYLSYSSDNGATFSAAADVDADTNDPGYPAVCVQGNQVLLVFQALDLTGFKTSVWGRVSIDGGAVFGARTQLRPQATPNSAGPPELACDGGSAGVAFFADGRSGTGYALRAARYSGTAWLPDIAAGGPEGSSPWQPSATFATGPVVLAAFEADGEVHLARSTDGGLAFGAAQRLDSAAPQPLASSRQPSVVADRAGNVFVKWMDHSAGEPSLAVRHSANDGAAFGTVRRANRGLPQGTRGVRAERYAHPSAAALPRGAIFLFAGVGTSYFLDTRLTGWDLDDFDRDGIPASSDCNDNDPGTSGPAEVAGVLLQKVTGATRVGWTSQDPQLGPDTRYDIAGGALANLLASGGYGAATCVVNDHADTPYDDTRPGPAPGAGFYYLVRSQNACGTASYGDATVVPDPRDALDAAGPCP